MALTKVQKTGITDNAIDADKIEDGTIVAADIAPGTITDAKLNSTLDLSSKTVTLPNTSVTNAMLAGSIANDKLANSSITVNGSSVSLGGSVSAGKVQWQSVKTADFNAVAGEGYFVDTDSVGAVTATLPGSPSAGDTIAIKDYAGTFGTNALTIGRNGNNIQGLANDSFIQTNRASIVLVYIDATKGWLFTNESNVANLENKGFTSATGGTVTTSGDYKYHVFTGDGCFVVSTAGYGLCACVPAGLDTVQALVVAGGGGATGNGAGGGGAGGLRNVSGIPITATTYPVTVGGGGSTSPSPESVSGTTSGSNTVFSTITSSGGGRGGLATATYPQPYHPGTPGGSGGGGSGNNRIGCGGTGNTPPVSPPQGNDGGTTSGSPSQYSSGSGGGGAGAVGQSRAAPASPSPLNAGGNGGVGVDVSPDFPGPLGGSPAGNYGGGGGGGANNDGPTSASGGTGGTGGGGSGGGNGGSATAGSTNTGGGGGGGPTAGGCGGTGGKGIVIVKYKFQ